MTTPIVKYRAYWGDRIQRVEVERETSHSVWQNGRRESKLSTSQFSPHRYCDTFEEAQAYLLKQAEQKLGQAGQAYGAAQRMCDKIRSMQNPEDQPST